jgi:methionine-rich copper-binding protein CopC
MRAGAPPPGFVPPPVPSLRAREQGVFGDPRVDSALVSTHSRRRRVPAAIAAIAPIAALVALLVAGAVPVLAHAELVSSDPSDGAQLATPPTTISLTFSEGLVAARSSFNLTQGGQALGTGHAARDGETTMTLDGPSLDPGGYVIQWTSVAEDGDVLRGTITFTVLDAKPAASTATAAPTETPRCTDDCGGTSPTPTVMAVTPTPLAPADTVPAASSGTDVLLPIVIGLLVVAGVGAFLVSRARRA